MKITDKMTGKGGDYLSSVVKKNITEEVMCELRIE